MDGMRAQEKVTQTLTGLVGPQEAERLVGNLVGEVLDNLWPHLMEKYDGSGSLAVNHLAMARDGG